MNNLPLQPLKWSQNNYAGIVTHTAKSPLHDYTIRYDELEGAYLIDYYERMTNEHGCEFFKSVDEAKNWAQSTHYPSKMQPYVKPDPIGAHFDNFTQWANDRQIIQNGDILAQGLKLVSEIGELADNLAKDRCIKDDIGDCFVVLNNLAHMTGLTLEDCMAQAWFDIKDRKGTMNEHGVFIKQGDI